VNAATNREVLGSVADIAETVAGELIGAGEAEITRLDIDSRTSTSGTLFVPLPGTRTDGHRFVTDALDRGASAVFYARNRWHQDDAEAPRIPADRGVILVDDPLRALQRLAAAHRRSREDLRWIGITGSNGKTTTKELLATILVEAYGRDAVFWSKGNYNSEIGLPLSVLEVRPEHKIAVLELAMNRAGEIGTLTEIARPHYAVITNIGDAHIGNLGSRDAIAEEKRRIFSMLGPDDCAFVYEDEPYRDFLLAARTAPSRVVTFGESAGSGFEEAELRADGGWKLRRRGREIRFRLPGRHNLRNALAAVSVAVELGVSDEAVAAGLSRARGVSGRSEVIPGSVTVINDAYNANPDSMRASFDSFAERESAGRHVVVIGEMAELGEYTEEAHRRVLDEARKRSFDLLVAVGETYRAAVEGDGPTEERSDSLRFVPDRSAAAKLLERELRAGDLVLLKGSRAAALERLIPAVTGAEI
jgi:UDP-N-acetylmuramoyl-tripeptide--D-alanyl-D-alanine ligase